MSTIESGRVPTLAVRATTCRADGGRAPLDPRRRESLAALLALAASPLIGCGGGDAAEEPAATLSPVAPSPRNAAPMGARTYSARWAATIVPEIGQVPVWTVSTETGTPTVKDCWGCLRNAKRGEARFWGARRVENKLRFSADLTNSTYWSSVGNISVVALTTDSRAADSTGAYRAHRLSKTGTNSARVQSVGVLAAVPHTFSVYARAETLSQVSIQVYVSGGAVLASGTFAIAASGWTRVQVSGTPDGTSSYRVLISPGPFVGTTPGSILVCDAQLEDVSGHPNPAASEYVASDRPNLPSWRYGAMVDAVRYYDTYKGNTVAAGIVQERAGTAIPESALNYLRLEPATTNLCTQSESFSTWTINQASLALAAGAATSPRGDATATRITESATSSSKFVSTAIGALATGTPITAACFAKAESASWLRLHCTLSDGSTVFAFFDLLDGQVGSVSSTPVRSAWAHIEPWGSGWFRCVLTTANSGGAAEPIVGVGVSSANGVTSYVGTGKTLLIWGAQASATEFAGSYVAHSTSSGTVTRQSQTAEIPNPSAHILGLQDYVVALDAYPAYYSGITIKGGLTPAWRPLWYAFASEPYRAQHRLGIGLRPTTVAFFGDRYLGDPNPLLFWRANTFYPAGSVVIPLDTQLNNTNRRRMFVCVVAGTSGSSEPAWNSTFVTPPDTSTHLTFDGSARWQNNHDNGINGQWEPYDTSVLDLGVSIFPGRRLGTSGVETNITASTSIRVSYFSAPGTYGFAVNGTEATLKTRPFPIDGSVDGDLHQPMESIRLARLSEAATSHPIGVGNLIISSETITAEENRLRSARPTA
jgi:hypothetical protein